MSALTDALPAACDDRSIRGEFSHVFDNFRDALVPVRHGGLDKDEIERAIFGDITLEIFAFETETLVISWNAAENIRNRIYIMQ